MENLNYPKSCGCVGTCGHGVDGSLGTMIQNPVYAGDIIGTEIIRNGWLDTNYIMRSNIGKGMASLLFDTDTVTYADGTKATTYVLKSMVWQGGWAKNVQITERNGHCVVAWYEGTVHNKSTAVVGGATAWATSLTLENPAEIGGLTSPLELIIKDSENQRRQSVVVASIDPANPSIVNLEAPLAFDVSETACVYRGHYNPASSCGASYANTIAFAQNDKEYYAYFTRILYTLEYNSRCQLNRTFLSDLLASDGGTREVAAYNIIKTQFNQQLNQAMTDFARSVFFHKNIVGTNGKNNETMGLLEAMKTAHTDATPQIYDLSICCDPASCEVDNAESLINTFLKIIRSRAQLDVYDSGKIMVAVNQEAEYSIIHLRKYFEMYSGAVITKEEVAARASDVISTRKVIYEVEDMGMTISFVKEEVLNELPFPAMIVMPEDTMGVFTYKNDRVDIVNGEPVIVPMASKELVAGDSLKFDMEKVEHESSRIDACSKWQMWVNYAIVWLFVDKCAYAMIKNFKLCNDELECHNCTDLGLADAGF